MREVMLTADGSGMRLDKWLTEQLPELSRSGVQHLIEQGAVLCNGKPEAKNLKLREGDSLLVQIPDPAPLEDVQRQSRLSTINGVIRPGIVHRIDKNTSGLLMVAKTDFAHQHLAEQIKGHSFTREYEAIACGRFREPSGTVDAPIGRSTADRQKMCVTEKNARYAVTHYAVLTQFAKHAHIRCRLETGRTHQIRVHMRYIGHPIYGDDVYGTAVPGLEGQCLHAKKIGFVHPVSGVYMEFDSALPDYFVQALKKVEHIHV